MPGPTASTAKSESIDHIGNNGSTKQDLRMPRSFSKS
jgi:hypothetical protein